MCLAHTEEVKNIVNKATKDLSIEITLKTYEEIWLSKLFEFSIYFDPKLSQAKSNKDEEVKLSHMFSSEIDLILFRTSRLMHLEVEHYNSLQTHQKVLKDLA